MDKAVEAQRNAADRAILNDGRYAQKYSSGFAMKQGNGDDSANANDEGIAGNYAVG